MATTLTADQREKIEARETLASYLVEIVKAPNMSLERKFAIETFAKRCGHNLVLLSQKLQALIDARELVKSKATSDVAAAEAAVRAAQAEAASLRERAGAILREAEAEAVKVKLARSRIAVAQARLDAAAGREVDAEIGVAADGFGNKILQAAFKLV